MESTTFAPGPSSQAVPWWQQAIGAGIDIYNRATGSGGYSNNPPYPGYVYNTSTGAYNYPAQPGQTNWVPWLSPILVAATAAPQTLTDTIMVCWNESTNAARAVTAATPLLARAQRVVFVSVAEGDDGVTDAVDDLCRQFAWNGVSAEVRVIPASRRAIPGALSAAAAECGADLVVMGAYGRSRVRELISGSCTDAVLDGSDRPILLMH